MTPTGTTPVENLEAERPLALGYVRAHASMTDSELAGAKSELASYAEREGFTLSEIFVERTETFPAGFRALIDRVRRDEPQAILTPNALHLALLGLPPRIMYIIHATTGIPVLLTSHLGQQ